MSDFFREICRILIDDRNTLREEYFFNLNNFNFKTCNLNNFNNNLS